MIYYQLIRTVLIYLLLTDLSTCLAQTTCNNGIGRVLYERLPNQQLQGFDDDVVRDTAPPFRVLEKCQDLCLRDRTASNNLVRTCTSFDFQPGSRIASFSGSAEYEETTCYLTREQAAPEGIGNLMLVPNSVHFTEVCLASSRPERECPSRRYVFERHPRKKLKLPISDIKEITAANRSDCEDKCLNEFSFVCRSANFDSTIRSCILSRFTRRTHPELLEDDPNSDYLENTCLNAERRCDGLAVFVKEENKRLGGPFEVDIFNNMTLEECQTMCLRAEKYFCRSVEFDDQTKQCILSEEDSISQKDDISISSSPTHHFYDLVCLDNQHGTDYPDNSVTSHLFSSGRRPDTAFQRYRNSRLGGEFHSEITGRSLSECLDECLRQTSFQCRSAVYSDRFRTCRLSRYNQRDGMRIIYDADYDYYENLMLNVVGTDNDISHRPETGGKGSWRPPVPDAKDRYPGEDKDRYPERDRYPESDRDRYPSDKYPGDERYPGDMYPPDDKYPESDLYPPSRPTIDRYPDDRDRYPDTYPDYRPYDRYPINPPPDYDSSDRYPLNDNRHRVRYPEYGTQYGYDSKYRPSDRYPDDNRLPGGNAYPSRPLSGDGRDPDRERYPANYGSRFGYDKYTPPHRYRPVYDNNLPDRDPLYLRPYPPPYDRAPYPYHDYLNRRNPPGTKYPLPPDNSYVGREHSFPDRRFRPSSFPGRHPLAPSYSPARYPGPTRYIPPDIIHGARRPEPAESDKNFPPPTIDSKYPATNRLPIGNDRYAPYKYGNGERIRGRPGYPPPPYYDMVEYEDRPYIPPSDYGHSYDREYDAGFSPRRPIMGYPAYEMPYKPPVYPDSYNSIGGSQRPQVSRCEEVDNFKQIAARHKMRRQFVRRTLTVANLLQCQRECIETRDFICRSFNYRESVASTFEERGTPNCELSDRDSRELDIHNPKIFDTANYDFYERSMGRSNDGDCLDVSQTCNEEGMEFTLRTPEGFVGRVYTYGFYDRCFFRGNGGTINVLRISGPQAYPECGTQRYGDTLTNIVVVQYSDNVQTSRDKRYNLTCVFRGPGEAVVTSGYIGAGLYNPDRSGSPIPIEYLPAENTLSSKVRLMILYQNRPTTTIAVGDPLTFRLEAQDGYNHVTDIFATNVVARDPYSGKSIQLIDRFGCPVDPYVFPELDKLRDGDTLEARFNAFKIPESNFLVFEATVRSCREGCQPAYCPGPSGRSEPSFGRRRRSINETEIPNSQEISNSTDLVKEMDRTENKTTKSMLGNDNDNSNDRPEQVREMIEVFESRDEIEQESFARKLIAPVETVCMTSSEYHGLISAIIFLMILMFGITLAAGLVYRRYWTTISKNRSADRSSPSFLPSTVRPHERFSEIGQMNYTARSSNHLRENMSIFGTGLQKTFATGNLARMCQIPVMNPIRNNSSQFDDPSEPIYTDPSLFERSRSLRSLSENNEV